jgi:hypothetical protein
MSLQDEIDSRRREIHTDGYPMSLGELANLYREGELDIHPEFQRIFRWSIQQKSRLIESLLLGIPIPSIFVYQREDAVWDVIDGLQRLGTVFEFMGIMKDENEKPVPPSVLKGTKYLPSLEGRVWEESTDTLAPAPSLDDTQRRLIKRASLDLKIVSRESDPDTPFELFQRLNSGGSQLSDQELRNALLIMVEREFYFWLKALQEMPSFQNTVDPSERSQDEQYDLELVLRFLALWSAPPERLRQMGDLVEFLTDTAVEMAGDGDLDRTALQATFSDTFEMLDEAMGSDAFKRHDPAGDRFLGNFSVSAFEAITAGVASNLEDWLALDVEERRIMLEARIKELWGHSRFRKYAKGGVRASTRIPQTVPLGRELIKP